MLKLRILFRPAFCTRSYRDNRRASANDFYDESDFRQEREKETPLKERNVVKNVYTESDITASRSEQEIEEFKKTHNITIEGNIPKPVLTIDELQVNPKLGDLFRQRNIDKPTPIQSLCWPTALSGQDMIGVAQTGSGKTLGYLLPSAMHIAHQPDVGHTGPLALVLAPTRELVQQITDVSRDWLAPSMRIRHCGVYGGASRLAQLNELRRGVQLCVATPGRLNDLISTRDLSLSNTSFLVLDEADRMLDMGFEPQIREIIRGMRPDRQTLMFSATWPQDVRSLAAQFMERDASRVNIGSTELCASKNISQELRFVEEDREKNSMLFDLLEQHQGEKILIFAATKRRVTHIAMDIIRKGIRCVESHGDLSQAKRERALELFKGPCNVMVATDVAARGLDVQNIKLVVNYDFPQTVEDYVHRIGRTGRLNARGRSVTFFSAENKAFAKGLADVLTQAGHEIPEKLQTYVEEKHQLPQFRRNYVKKPTNYRLDRASNWRRYSNSY